MTEVRVGDLSQPGSTIAPTRFISGGAEGTSPVPPTMLRVSIVPVGSGPVTVSVTNDLGGDLTDVVVP